MPLYMLIRPRGRGSRKGNKMMKGLKDILDSHTGPEGAKSTSQLPTAHAPLPCYTADAPQEFDEVGKELDIDAQVWKTYVRETGQVDRDFIKALDKSIDVIPLFGGLFSAITTAFVIESYKDIIKPDTATMSSQTLLAISQILAFNANGSHTAYVPATSQAGIAASTVSTKDVCVNALWFLSLSLSIGASMISMLAKEWCVNYISGRAGSHGAQARRRQQRWDRLVKWRMREVISLLPAMIHLSVICFLLGLCIFLWKSHHGIFIPMTIVNALVAGAYFVFTLLPVLYDYCPYGTTLSRLFKQLTTIPSGVFCSVMPQDVVTAKALNWMLVTCETPRSVDIALQSLAAADENLPIVYLDTGDARVMAKLRQRLKRLDMDRESEQNRKAAKLYARAVKAYLQKMCNSDPLIHGYNHYIRLQANQAFLIQTTIQTLINELPTPIRDDNRQLLDQCAAIGHYYVASLRGHDASSIYWGSSGPGRLEQDLMNRIEQCWGGDQRFSDLHCILFASLAFRLCCNQAIGLKRSRANTEYTLKMIDGCLSAFDNFPTDASLQQTVTPYLVLGTSWVWVSSTSTDKLWQAHPRPEAFAYLWANLMTIAYSNIFALDHFDFNNPIHSMWHLLTHPGQFNLSQDNCFDIERAIVRINDAHGSSTKMQSIYHAYYIHELSSQLDPVNNEVNDEIIPQILFVVDCLRSYAPWEDAYLLPTIDIYIFTLTYLCTTGNTSDSWDIQRAYYILEYSPIPKCSPQLVQQLSSSNLIPRLAAAMSSQDVNTRVFATAQLGVFFHMALSEADRSSPALTRLEAELLKYSELDYNLERLEVVVEELEGIMSIVPPICDDHLQVYAYRVLEVMLQRRSTPLPQIVDECLEFRGISRRLRGIGSFVNYETERCAAYPDLVFDSEGRPSLAAEE